MRTKHVDTPKPVTEANLLAVLGPEPRSLQKLCLALGYMFVNRGAINRATGIGMWTVDERATYNAVGRALQVLQELGKVAYVRGKGAGWIKTAKGAA